MSDIIIKQALIGVGKYVGDTVGGGISTMSYGSALSLAEMINVVSRLQDGTLRASDIFSATVAVKIALLGFLIVAAVPGIGIEVVV